MLNSKWKFQKTSAHFTTQCKHTPILFDAFSLAIHRCIQRSKKMSWGDEHRGWIKQKHESTVDPWRVIHGQSTNRAGTTHGAKCQRKELKQNTWRNGRQCPSTSALDRILVFWIYHLPLQTLNPPLPPQPPATPCRTISRKIPQNRKKNVDTS